MAQVPTRLLDDQALDGRNTRAQLGVPLHEQLRRLRTTTPAAGRYLNVAALIREERDA